MIFAQHRHDLLGLGGFGERREAAQIAEHDRDVAAVAVEHLLVAVAENEFGDLRRQEALEPAMRSICAELIGDALLERLVPAREIGRLAATLSCSSLTRSIDLTRATSDVWSTGLVRYSSAPASSPATTSLVSALAVHQNDRHERQARRRP